MRKIKSKKSGISDYNKRLFTLDLKNMLFYYTENKDYKD